MSSTASGKLGILFPWLGTGGGITSLPMMAGLETVCGGGAFSGYACYIVWHKDGVEKVGGEEEEVKGRG